MGALIKLAAVVFLFSTLISIADQRQPKWEINQLKKQIAGLQRNIRAARKEETALAKELNHLEKEIVSLNANIKKGKDRLQQIEQENIELNTEWQRLIRENENTRDTLRQLLRSSYMLGRQSGIKLLLNQQNPMEISRALAFYRYFIESKNRYIEEIQDRRREIDKISDTLRRQEEKIDETLSVLRQNRQFVSKKDHARRARLNLVQKQLSEDTNLVDVYRKRKEELAYLLTNLQHSVSRMDRDGTRQKRQRKRLLSGFENNKGQLGMPSVATVKHRYGEKRRESGLIWEGLMLDVEEGQEVAAIYPGQVVYADWFRGYGQLMVLDHGDGFMSLYGHNRLLHVQLGDSVGAGEIIASAGSTGGLLAPGLYFEIRENGKPVDPLQWCRL